MLSGKVARSSRNDRLLLFEIRVCRKAKCSAQRGKCPDSRSAEPHRLLDSTQSRDPGSRIGPAIRVTRSFVQQKYKKALHHARAIGGDGPARQGAGLLSARNWSRQTSSSRKRSGVQIPLPALHHHCSVNRDSPRTRRCRAAQFAKFAVLFVIAFESVFLGSGSGRKLGDFCASWLRLYSAMVFAPLGLSEHKPADVGETPERGTGDCGRSKGIRRVAIGWPWRSSSLPPP